MGARLGIRGLEVRFPAESGDAPALRGLDLELEAGARHGLVGASGSGKSVTALAVLGLLPAGGRRTAGTIELDGRRIDTLQEAGRHALRGRTIGYVPQDPTAALHPSSRVDSLLLETLRTHRSLSRSAARAEAEERLAEVGLDRPATILGRYPHELSGGQRQRVLLALGLAGDPSLLLADEPTSALDPISAARVLEVLSSCCEARSMSLLLISHDLDAVARVCSEASVVDAGRVVERAEIPTLLRAPTTVPARTLVRAARALGARG